MLKNIGKYSSYEAAIGFDLYFEYFKMSPEIKVSHSFKDVIKREGHPYDTPIDRAILRNFTFSLFLSKGLLIKSITLCKIQQKQMAKIALITGATSGIGAACADTFAAQGYDLILVARRENLLDTQAQQLNEKYGVKIKKLIADVRDKENINYVLDTLPGEWKNVDVLVNNAGLSQGLIP